MDQESKNESPKWLVHLQENSWEAEILISGGAIFSLFQLLDWVSLFVSHLKEITRLEGTNETFIFLHLAVNGLIIGFICHLVLRSLWIALVCLRYAYPVGINLQKLNIQPAYLKESKSANLTDQIIKLDHLSGLVFFSAISFVLIIAGAILVSLTAILTKDVFQFAGVDTLNVYAAIYLIFVFDLLSLGWIRRWKPFAVVYRPFYLFFNYVSLAFIFRPWLQVLFTNVSRWKLYIVGILFITASVGLTILTVSRPMHWRNVLDRRKSLAYSGTSVLWTENFYDNKNLDELRVSFACIQQDIVSDDVLHVFVPYYARYDEFIDKASAKRFEDIVSLKIDDAIVDPEWLVGKHLSSDQDGITAYIPIEKLPPGKHTLAVAIKNAQWPFPLTIPFWKQK